MHVWTRELYVYDRLNSCSTINNFFFFIRFRDSENLLMEKLVLLIFFRFLFSSNLPPLLIALPYIYIYINIYSFIIAIFFFKRF